MLLRYKPVAFCLLLFFAACSQPAARIDTTKALILDHFKYLNAHNLPALRAQYADSAFISSPVAPSDYPGPRGAEMVFHYTFLLSANIEYQVRSILTTDSSAVVQYDVRGNKVRDMPAIFFTYKACSIFRIRNAKIDTEIMYNNPSSEFAMVNNRFVPVKPAQ